MISRLLFLSIALVSLAASPARAQWQRDGVPVCRDPSDQFYPILVPDGHSGAILFWEDMRNGSHIYAQRLNAAGVPLWSTDGVLVTSSAFTQRNESAVSDGLGGAFVAYEQVEGKLTHLYTQHVNANGILLWGTGYAIGATDSSEVRPVIISDNKHGILVGQTPGAIIAWLDNRNPGMDDDVYIEAIDNTGTPRWAPVAVDASSASVSDIAMTTDAIGSASSPKGAILTWIKLVSGEWKVYAQRIDANGVQQYGSNGVPAGNAIGNQYEPRIVSTGAGNAIVTWEDLRNGGGDNIYGQHFGSTNWQADGLPICRASGGQGMAWLIGDGAGGAIAGWQDVRANNSDAYAQRVDAGGNPLWTVDGVPASTDASNQIESVAVSDFASGAIIAWSDSRFESDDIFAQHLNGAGAPIWDADGLPLCAAPGQQNNPALISDDVGGAIVSWQDTRNGNYDIYAQHIPADGSIVGAPPALPAGFRALPPIPNPARDGTTLRFELPDPARVSVQVFDVHGRVVRSLIDGREMPAGTQSVHWDGRNASGARLPSGVYLFEVKEGNRTASQRVLILRGEGRE